MVEGFPWAMLPIRSGDVGSAAPGRNISVIDPMEPFDAPDAPLPDVPDDLLDGSVDDGTWQALTTLAADLAITLPTSLP